MLRCGLSHVYANRFLAALMGRQNSLGRNTLQPRCIESQVSNKFWLPFVCAERNVLALSECQLVTPSKLRLQRLQRDDEKVSYMCSCGTSF